MARRFAIINLSDGDGEDMHLSFPELHGGHIDHDLPPGESITIGEGYGTKSSLTVAVRFDQRAEVAPEPLPVAPAYTIVMNTEPEPEPESEPESKPRRRRKAAAD